MKAFYEWGIPAIAFLVWAILIFTLIPSIMRRLKRKAEQTRAALDDILISVLSIPLIFFFLGLGLNFFIQAVPLPKNWVKYSDALLIILFVLAGYLFLDRLMMEVLRRYSKKVEILETSAGVMKTLYRAIILGFIFLVVLDRLKITITPFLASLGIGGLVVALALQDTLANFFAGMYIFFDRPIRIGDYIMLESGKEGYVAQIGWRSTRVQMLPNNILIVPNSKLISSQITNFYLPETEMAVLVQVGVSYDSDLAKVERVTIEVAKEILASILRLSFEQGNMSIST
jgi:small-conductance mechanosensitive channel